MDLAIYNVRCVDRPHLPALSKRKVNAFPRLPAPGDYCPTAPGGSRKQMQAEILNALFPVYAFAAFPAPLKHFTICEGFL